MIRSILDYWTRQRKAELSRLRKEANINRKIAAAQAVCEHTFLSCSSPNMTLVEVGYQIHEWVAQGTNTYHVCSKCKYRVS